MSANRQSKVGELGLLGYMCVCVLVLAGTASASMIHVDDDATYDPGPGDPMASDPDEDGSAAHPFDAIQEGIDAALPGDEVVILDGTYTGDGNRDLDFGGKDITVRSMSGDPTTCVVDCQASEADPHRGFYFHSGETSASVVRGLTITGGYVTVGTPGGTNGGGVYCSDSSPTLADNRIINNTAGHTYTSYAQGAGVYYANASPLITGCTISGNTATCEFASRGAGLYCLNTYATVRGCTITDNLAVGDSFDGCPWVSGGGVYSTEGHLNMQGCTISDNVVDSSGFHSDGSGGGVHCKAGTITDCTITDNSCNAWSSFGGGVYSSNTTLTRCIIRENSAPGNASEALSGGGGIAPATSTLIDCEISENSSYLGANVLCFHDAVFQNCTISGNSSASIDGVHCCWCTPTFLNCRFTDHVNYSCLGFSECYDPVVTNCTFLGNKSSHGPGAISCSSTDLTITNCTFFANESTSSTGGALTCYQSDVTVTNSIFWGGSPQEIYVSSGSAEITYSCIQNGWVGEGNLEADPLFVDPLGPDGAAGTDDDNLRLQPGSPCIDAGTNSPTGGLPAEDPDGSPRVLDGDGDGEAVVDMGAYEYRIPMPDQLTVIGPNPNEVPIDGEATVQAQLMKGFVPVPYLNVLFTKVSGGFLFLGEGASPDGTQATCLTDSTGSTEATLVGNSVGPALLAVSVPGTDLPTAYYVFEIVLSTPGLTPAGKSGLSKVQPLLVPAQAKPTP